MPAQLSQKQKVSLVVGLTIEGLVEKGFLFGPQKVLTNKGRTQARRLLNEGFEPTQSEVNECYQAYLNRMG